MSAANQAGPTGSAERWLAEPEERVEGALKVTGRARYTADFQPEGMLWAAYVTSPHPHARIAAIDTTEALRVSGVHAVITGDDTRPARIGRALMDWPALADGKVRFIGERVAAVAGETIEAAEEAVRLIRVEYQELPALLDPEQALQDDAPVLHENAADYTFLAGTRAPVAHPNIQGHYIARKGEQDIDAALAGAHRVFQHVFHTPRQHTGYIEPHGTLVWIDGDDMVHLLGTNKAPFVLRRQFAAATGLAPDRVVVEPNFIGGDFGGKGLSLDELTAYFLARATGRPVRSVMSYAEDMQSSTTRHAATVRLTTGVDQDGHFLAHKSEILFDGGAYAAGKALPMLVPIGGLGTLGPYRVPVTHLELKVVYTNTIPAGHMRAPGEVQAQFAGESHVDMIARELGMDPVEFRLLNAARPGDTGPANERFREVRAVDVLEALKRETAWGESPLPAGRGRGVALAMRGMFQGTTGVRYRLERDGGVTVITGQPEQGSGSHTMIRRVAAATLSVDLARISVVRGNTNEAPFDPGASASWVTAIVGQATQRGAVALKAKLEDLAAEAMGWPAGEVSIEEDRFIASSTGDSAPFAEVAARIARGESVVVDGVFEAPPPGTAGEGDANYCAYLAEVDVDRETGHFEIRELVLALDSGAIISPIAHQGQLDGSVHFGLGAALMEDLVVDQGRVTNPSLGDYKIPTQCDMPSFRTILVPTAIGPGPFGAKAAGEVANSAVAPAVANAVADAIGVRVTELPLTPERILAALQAQQTHSRS